MQGTKVAIFSQGLYVIDKRCNWFSLFLSSLKETCLIENYVSLLHEVHFEVISYCCVWLPLVIRQPEGISSASSPIAKTRELTCFCSLFPSRSEASLNHSKVLIQPGSFWLAKGEPFGKLITWCLSHVSSWVTFQSVAQWNQNYVICLWNQFANATGACIIWNVVIDFVYKFNVNFNQWPIIQANECPIQCETFDVSVRLLFQCWCMVPIQWDPMWVSNVKFPMGRSNQWEVPM